MNPGKATTEMPSVRFIAGDQGTFVPEKPNERALQDCYTLFYFNRAHWRSVGYVHSFEYHSGNLPPLTEGAILGRESTTQACAMAPSTGTERHELTARLKEIPGVGELFPVTHVFPPILLRAL
jgi:hypothetical protein